MSIVMIPENHICLSASHDLIEIAQPLFGQSPINFFDFARIFKDGLFMVFATNPDFLKYYYQKGYKFLPSISLNQEATTYHLVTTNHLLKPNLTDIKERFSIDNCFMIIQNKVDYIDIFGFGTNPNLHQPMNFYLNQLERLEKFTLYFKEKAQSIIQLGSQNRLQFKENIQKEYQYILTLLNSNQASQAEIFFNRLIPIFKEKVSELITQWNVNLTKREIDCMVYNCLGMSTKLISHELNISCRTVESYLAQVKKKFGLRSKSDILTLFKL